MKDFYITTSIMYTNAGPHIGHALELLQADIIARYQRIFNNRKVFFLTGTDDHGVKIAQIAEENKMNYKKFVDKNANLLRELIKKLDISNDDFIQTSDVNRHYPTVIKVWNKLLESGDLYKKQYTGHYCVGCESFLSKKELNFESKCLVHNKKPEKVTEENYFFRLSKYLPQIKQVIENDIIEITPKYKKEIMGIINNLDDISFSRSKERVKWGIPVPNNSTQLIYVWGDALVNYLTAIDYLREGNGFNKWPADIQVIGRDIVKFHAIIWLGILFSLKLPLPKKIFVHGFILDKDGRKMSKSLGNTLSPINLIDKYKTDAFRYLLLKEVHPIQDSNFSLDKIKKTYNADLVKGLGNLISRVLAIIEKNTFIYDKNIHISCDVDREIRKNFSGFKKNIEKLEFNSALQKIMILTSFANKYIDNLRPWEQGKNQKRYLYELLIIFINLAKMLYIIMPGISSDILSQLGINKENLKFNKIELEFDFSACTIKKGRNLFKKDLII